MRRRFTSYGDLAYKLWVDANRNIIVAEIKAKTPQSVTVSNEGWRNERTKYDFRRRLEPTPSG
jgi:hypothetical protein